jgi:hypothetical protein
VSPPDRHPARPSPAAVATMPAVRHHPPMAGRG